MREKKIISKWSKEFPTPKKRTSYWFYGWAFGLMGLCDTSVEDPKLIIVDVRRTANDGHLYIGDGHFIHEKEAIGVWKKFEGIETPSVDELRKIVGDAHNEVF